MQTLHPILQALADRLLTSPDDPLRLDSTMLGIGSEAIIQLFDEVLFQDFLSLTSAQIAPNTDNYSLLVSGIAVDPHFDVANMNLLCTFSILNNSTLSLNVKLTPPALSNWTFPTSFYELEGTFFQTLSYTSPAFILSTHDYHDTDLDIDVVAGASFYILPTGLDGPLAPASLLTNNTPSQLPPFYGPLIEDNFSRQLTLHMPFSNITLDLSGIPTIGMSESALVLSDTHSVQPEYVLATISVQGNVQIGNVILPLYTQLPTSISYWQIGLLPNRRVSLPDIVQFLGSISGSDLTAVLPGQIIDLPDFYVDMFNVTFDMDNLQFQALNLAISSDSNLWTLIPDFLSLDRIALELDVQRVVQSDRQIRTDISGTISGTFEIVDTVAVTAQINLPNAANVLTLTTSSNLSISLDDLTRYVGGVSLHTLLPGDVGSIGDFTLARSSLTIDLGTPNLIGFDFNLFSTNDWVIIPNRLVMKNINLTMRVNQPLGEREIIGFIRGTIGIGQADVEVNISRELPSMDWEMQVRAYVIPLPSLSDMTTLVDSDLNSYLPDGLGSTRFMINDLAIDLNLSNTTITQISFVLSAELNWRLYLSQDNQMSFFEFSQVNIGIRRSETDLIGFILANFQLAGVNLEVFAERTSEGWQFNSSTGEGQAIAIGLLINDLANVFGNVFLPAAIAGMTIENLMVSFNSATRNFSFMCEGTLPLNSRDFDILLTIDITRNESDGTYTKHFGGRIMIGRLQFDLLFVQEAASNHFVAVYSHTAEAQALNVRALVSLLSDTVAAYIPDNLEINLRDVVLAFSRDDTATKFLFALDIATAINLSQLPLIGPILPSEQTIRVDDLKIVVASAALSQEEVTAFNSLIPAASARLQVQPLAEGFSLSAAINFGSVQQMLNLPVAAGVTDSMAPAPPASMAANVTAADNARWFTLQKSFGPVHLERIGVQYQDAVVAFLLDAALSAAGLTLSLDGLSVSSPLNQFVPQFNLRGLGIDYRSGPVEIGGAFLRQQVQAGGETYDEYDGQAVIKTEALTLSAIGSYARLDGHPSLFIYAVLDYPLGGPAFFFVTGLSAGFGYNRTLRVPGIEQIVQFPLVAEAINNPGTRNDLAQELQNLRQYIPIGVGDNFLAVGVKFTSFKIIDSFALVTVSFGRRFELDVLGLSTLIVPTPETGNVVTPLAEVQMAMKASFIPDDGFLGVSAQLTNASYILSRNCHLTGGFAFYSWFAGENAGDFVQTLGGYHPRLRPPEHYPQVPRLGFNWRVNDELSLKGQAYYALTPSALMAGGRLEATWRSGSLKACFVAGADFLLAWKPYHYEAHAFVDIAVAYTFRFFGTHHISAHLGADLQISGPEFSGRAHVQWSVISFDVTFGRPARRRPQAINWDTFRTSFLPDDTTVICSLSVQEGLVNSAASGESVDWIVNPKGFTLLTNALIPSEEAYLHTTAIDLTASGHRTDFGIGPMAVPAADLTTWQTITITRDGEHVEEAFTLTPVLKSVPIGLWGQSLMPNLNGPRVIENTLAGFTIVPKNPPAPGATTAIDRGRLQFATVSLDDVYDWAAIPSLVAQTMDEPARRQALRDSILAQDTVTVREQLLATLGFEPEINLNQSIADTFVIAPQIAV